MEHEVRVKLVQFRLSSKAGTVAVRLRYKARQRFPMGGWRKWQGRAAKGVAFQHRTLDKWNPLTGMKEALRHALEYHNEYVRAEVWAYCLPRMREAAARWQERFDRQHHAS